MRVKLHISDRLNLPVYIQITEQVKYLIRSGQLPPRYPNVERVPQDVPSVQESELVGCSGELISFQDRSRSLAAKSSACPDIRVFARSAA